MNFQKLLKSIVITTALSATGIAFSTSLQAEVLGATAEEKGLNIAKERKARDEGWGDSTAKNVMTLRNSQGQESIREMRMKSLEIANDGDKGLTIFDKPKDVKGTAFLNFSHIEKSDEQWLFLPALKRVKRISSRNKSGPFMGSEFAYEDLSSFELEKYKFKLLGEEQVNGVDCYKIEQIPTDKYSGYTKQIAWLDKAEYRSQKVEFYDRKKQLVKTLTFADYNQYLNKYWRAGKMSMVNHVTKKSTDIIVQELKFKTGLKEKDFNKSTLKRAR